MKNVDEIETRSKIVFQCAHKTDSKNTQGLKDGKAQFEPS